MRLSDFMSFVCEEANRQIGSAHLSLDFIYRVMDVDSLSNKELANPLNKDPSVFYFRTRQTPLSGNEEIVGEYFLFEYIFHFEEMWLREMRSLQSIEERIVGSNGISNGYTACMVAITGGKVKPYAITDISRQVRAYTATSFKVVNGVMDKKGKRIVTNLEEKQIKIRWLD